MTEALGDILTRHGSDKDIFHRYGPVYDSLFPDREAVRLVLEIGVDGGRSLRAWREAFPNARIVGLDIRGYPNSLDGRIECHKGDQASPADLLRAAAGRRFDLIVDDASHRLADQLLSLFVLWPYLAPGGYYVIEDVDAASNPTGAGQLKWRDNFALIRGATVHETMTASGPEPLVVVRRADA